LYGQNVEFQSGSSERGRRKEEEFRQRRPTPELGAPLVKYTDNSSILIQQGFQRLRDRFKLLNKVRKILKGERTQHCFFNRVDRNDGVGVMFNKSRNKANYSYMLPYYIYSKNKQMFCSRHSRKTPA